MKDKEAADIMDQLETSCIRVEEARKDKDLMIAIRALYKLYEERVRNGKEALSREP